MRGLIAVVALVLVANIATAKMPKYHTQNVGSFVEITNEGGRTLGYSPQSGVKILEVEGFAFKDLNRNGRLDRYEDWRLTAEERAANLAAELPISSIAGLMVHSSYQRIPSKGTYNGVKFEDAGVEPSALDDTQHHLIEKEQMRHLLVTKVCGVKEAAEWSNNIQALCEKMPFGIPANNSTNPRTSASGKTSVWGSSLSLAATFNPEIVARYADVASQELRAMGITTLLAPQVEIATEPRWMRVHETFGESSALSVELTRAYIDGFQSSADEQAVEGGWGTSSVITMAKHWPGSGTGEAGRDAHYAYGKYSVFPGNNFEEHLLPFTQGALQLKGKTKSSAAIMASYNIYCNQDTAGESVGACYSKYIVEQLLRTKYGYEGVVCSDWRVPNHYASVYDNNGKPWGVEHLSIEERYLRMILSGVDQVGGISTKQYIEKAYELGVKRYGEDIMRKRYELSAQRLLVNMFRVGLFDNPYLDIDESVKIVDSQSFRQEGLAAQRRSVIMLKNSNGVLPLRARTKVFIPEGTKLDKELVARHFEIVAKAEDADCAIVLVEGPKGDKGYSKEDAAAGGNGYMPISLQYGDYTAKYARRQSLVGGDPMESFTNRSYQGKSTSTYNKMEMERVNDTKRIMGKRATIVIVQARRPLVFGEIEPYADALLVGFGLQQSPILDIIAGVAEPQGLLPMQMPRDMRAVEQQKEDLPFDMKCYKDSEGNIYDFAFGLNWSGVIKDSRVERYKK